MSVLILSLLSISCGANNATTMPTGAGAVSETIVVPVKKDKVAVEILIVFSGRPNDEKTALLYKKVRPIIGEAVRAESINWGDTTPIVGASMYGLIDGLRIHYSKNLCDRINQSIQKDFERNPIAQCRIVKLEKI